MKRVDLNIEAKKHQRINEIDRMRVVNHLRMSNVTRVVYILMLKNQLMPDLQSLNSIFNPYGILFFMALILQSTMIVTEGRPRHCGYSL